MSENFIQDLSAQEKIIFVRALFFLVKIDGRVDDRERECMHEIVEIYGLSDNLSALQTPMSEENILNEIKTIDDRHKALCLLRELLTMANIDDELGDDEINFISKAARVLNVEESKVLEINSLILDRKLWLLKSAKVMEE